MDLAALDALTRYEAAFGRWQRLLALARDAEEEEKGAEYVRYLYGVAEATKPEADAARDALRRDLEIGRAAVEAAFAALDHWRHEGCPACGCDCASANPPVVGCPLQALREADAARAKLRALREAQNG